MREGLYLVYEVVLREIDPDGKVLLFPEVEFSGYWSSIADVEEVIKLYRGHATSEQFHSEFKTDMGLERFPSGKFETNHTVLVLAILTFNILKLIGLSSFGHYPPESRGLYRLRIRTIIQDLIYLAIRFVKKGGKKMVQLSRKWTFSLIFWETVVSPT
ncbi:MAG: transposase [Brevinematales bacterium]|nr:transposase [Brevinematales bacterium]